MAVTARQILESIPDRFRPEKAQGYFAVFHFDISDEESLQYTVTVGNGHCTLQSGLHGQPHCVVKTKASVYVDLETGKANPQMALMTGRVKISNLAAMMQFTKCFRRFQETGQSTRLVQIPHAPPVQRAAKSGPLEGVRIIDFTRLLPGPLATMFLADMGADVIKIEDPDNPDYIRSFEPMVNGLSMFYLSLNRSKRSLAVNYLSAEGRQIILDLIKTADVLVEQFRPGVMQEMGFGYEALSVLNPKLIYVSITGYGQNSSKASDAGHDLNYSAIAGTLGITGEGQQVVIPGFQLADIGGGAYMAMNAVTAALYQREKTGRGDWVDVSMTDATLPFAALQFAYHQGTKQNPGRGNFELSGALANYHVYSCKDGGHVALGSLEPKFWNRFCDKVGRPDWSERILSNDEKSVLKEEVKQFFLTKTRAEWLDDFKGEDFCLTQVNELDEIEDDPYLNERNMFLANEHPSVGKYATINQPLKFKHTNFGAHWSAPELGADSANILHELNYSDQTISGWDNKGIIRLK